MSAKIWLFRNSLWVVIGVLLVLIAMNATAMGQADVEEKNRQTIQTAFDNWRRSNRNFFDLLASDAKWTIVGLATVSGTYHSRRDFLD